MSGESEEKAFIYFLFSRLFREAPGPCLLKEIIEKKLLVEDLEWLKQVEEIAVEHTALFVVSGESYTPPYESYYCDLLTIDTTTADSCYFQSEPFLQGMKGFIGGSSTQMVKKFCEESGFTLSLDFHDLPDHIACELELMGRLYQEGKADQAGSFFKNHLGRWVFAFLANLQKQKRSLFYQKVAAGLNQFLEQDANALLRRTEGGCKND